MFFGILERKRNALPFAGKSATSRGGILSPEICRRRTGAVRTTVMPQDGARFGECSAVVAIDYNRKRLQNAEEQKRPPQKTSPTTMSTNGKSPGIGFAARPSSRGSSQPAAWRRRAVRRPGPASKLPGRIRCR